MFLFVSNIGVEYFIGLVGSGVLSGIVVVVFEWGVRSVRKKINNYLYK